MYVRVLRAVALAVALVLAAARCAPKERPATVTQTIAVDSQPIQVVEGSAPDGAALLGVVVGATRLADGTIVVADFGGSALKFFDGQGRLVRTVGREGSGPGEFGWLNGIKRCGGDSLFATDAGHGVSVFSASGDNVREFRLPGFSQLAACSPAGVLAVVRSGEGEEGQVPMGTEVRRLWETLSLAGADGVLTHEVGLVPLYDIHTSGNGWLPRPGTAITSFAVGRGRLVTCPTDSGAVGAFSLRGKRLRAIPLDVSPRTPSRAYVETFADKFVSMMPSGLQPRFRERFLRIPPAEHLPPCSKVLMDPDDNVWVVLSVFGDSVTTLRVFGRDDRVLGDVMVPAALEVHEIGADYLLASGESADGEPWVKVYRVRRTAAP